MPPCPGCPDVPSPRRSSTRDPGSSTRSAQYLAAGRVPRPYSSSPAALRASVAEHPHSHYQTLSQVDGEARALACGVRDLGRDEVLQLEDRDLSLQRGADRPERGLESLLVEALGVLLGVPHLRDLHNSADLAGAVHDEPKWMPVLDVDLGVDRVVGLPVKA